jgi:TM2 domain-containing membrane protein YozV
VAPTAQEVYAQPVHEQPTVYEQPQFPQTVYDGARATGHPVYEQPQPAAQGQPTTQINQTFVTHQPQQVPMPMYSAGDRKNPGVAAILSFFYAGLGQIYNGQLLKGIGFMVVYALSIASILIVIGFILVPLVWVIGIYDAYHTAKSYNEKQIQNEMAYHASLARR